jgi:hypothetical protein
MDVQNVKEFQLGIKKIKTLENFINDAIYVHGNKYDYSKVEYVNSNTLK